MKSTKNMVKWGALLAGTLGMLAFGCQTKEQTGTVAGAGVGALAGAAVGDNLVGGLIGGVVGGVVGREIGQALDDADDREQVVRALETGQPVSWVDQEEGYRYRIRPVRSFNEYQGVRGPCREFEMDIYTDQGVERASGVACREGEAWRVIGT